MVQSILRAIELLEVLNGTEESYSIAQLSEKLNLPPSTIHRILQTLCHAKYVVQDEKSHDYQLGPALIPLGLGASKRLHLRNIAYSVIKKIAAETEEDSFLIVPIGNKGVVLDRVDGPSTLKIVEEFGYEMYLHSGAVRKALLAFQSQEFIDNYIEEVLPSPKCFPKISKEELLESLRKTREEGVALSSGDYLKGTIGIGAPVFDASGKAVASVGIVVPTVKVDDEKFENLKNIIKKRAKELSNSLGYF